MASELFGLPPYDEQTAWAAFPKTLIQKVLHNEMVRQIEKLRGELESAAPEKVIELQQAIKAHRFLLGLIHRNDKLPTK